MSRLPRPARHLWRPTAALTFGLFVVLLLAVRPVVFGPPVLEWGDLAVNALQIENAKRGAEIYGNYSRFHFNHPGPAFFYVYALGEYALHDVLRLVRSPHQAHLVAGIVLQAAFCALALVLMANRFRPPLTLPFAALLLGIHYGWAGGVFTSLWPPQVLAMPFLCLLLAGASAASGRPRHGLIALVAAGFLGHGHVAQALFVGGLGIVIIVQAWRWHRRSPPGSWSRRDTVLAAMVAGLFALPLAIDVLQHGLTGNTATIVRRFVTNTGDAKSPLQALLYFVSFATPSREQHLFLAEIGPATAAFFRANAGWLVLWGGLLVAVAVGYRRLAPTFAPEERRFVRAATLVWATAVLLALVWSLAQAGPLFYFNGAFFVSLYALPLLLGAVMLARWAEHRTPRLLAPACYAIASVVLLQRLSSGPLDADSAGVPVRQAVDAALASATEPTRAKVLLFDAADWSAAAAVGLALERRGIAWFTQPRWRTMFQERHDLSLLAAEDAADAAGWVIRAASRGDGLPPLDVTIQPLPRSVQVGRTVLRSDDNLVEYAWSGLEITRPHPAYTVAEQVRLILRPEPSGQDVRIVFDAASNDRIEGGPRAQPAEIRLDGAFVGRVVAGVRSELAVTVPAARWNAAAGRAVTLELQFPNAVRNVSFSRPRAREAYAWTLWSVRFEPIE